MAWGWTLDWRPCSVKKITLAKFKEVKNQNVRFPGTTKKKIVGLERGPLSLVITTEELLDRKLAAPV
jgi:hypothetical protein